MDSVQARIVALRNHARARRQVKPIASSSVNFVVTESPQFSFHISGDESGLNFRTDTKWLKFIPNDHKPGYFYFNLKSTYYMRIVPGSIGSDGSIAIVANEFGVYPAPLSITFSIVAIGVTSGTFIEL